MIADARDDGGLDGAKAVLDERFHDAIYDDVTGTWTLTIDRERGDPDGVPYAAISRVYTLWLLNAEGLSTSARSAWPRMAASRLLKSWAMLPARTPRLSSF